MMISPETFISQHEKKSYAALLVVRDELIDEIRAFEKQDYDPYLDFEYPDPDTIYQCNLEYLAKLCELISQKFSRKRSRRRMGPRPENYLP